MMNYSNRVWPEFKLWEQFASDVLIPSLQVIDALESAQNSSWLLIYSWTLWKTRTLSKWL